MSSKPVIVGLCTGVAVGLGAAMVMKPSKKHMGKNAVGKTLRVLGDMADSVSSSLGW